ncbi:MAG: hypothetical protein HY864_01205 [Chloroflexi bacterium]|nr:hypothetical protein [Chloroflexota bacterium]
MSKKHFNFLTTIFVIFGMLSATSTALADSGGSSSKGEVSGTISAVGASSLTITPKKGGADVTVTVDASTRIKRNGKTALLSDFQVGEKVEAKYDKTSMLASKVEAKTRSGGSNSNGELKGTISAVGAGSLTITPKKGGADVTITVDASTRIKRGGKTALLTDLQVGDKVEAKYNKTTMLASKVEAKSATSGGKDSTKKGEVRGVISAIGSATVTITPSKGGADVTLMVDSSTRYERGRTHITLADLMVGDRVEAKYNPTTMLASKIETR